ncbi:MAG: hypothetical protein EHM93_13120 [Bacteroidales bacterium]|nr:MAG: hypothetical protein EHM93_13120 [Bacteroidales bacterium]
MKYYTNMDLGAPNQYRLIKDFAIDAFRTSGFERSIKLVKLTESEEPVNSVNDIEYQFHKKI